MGFVLEKGVFSESQDKSHLRWLAAPLVIYRTVLKQLFFRKWKQKWDNQKNSVKTLREKLPNWHAAMPKKNIKIQNEFFILISFNFCNPCCDFYCTLSWLFSSLIWFFEILSLICLCANLPIYISYLVLISLILIKKIRKKMVY